MSSVASGEAERIFKGVLSSMQVPTSDAERISHQLAMEVHAKIADAELKAKPK